MKIVFVQATTIFYILTAILTEDKSIIFENYEELKHILGHFELLKHLSKDKMTEQTDFKELYVLKYLIYNGRQNVLEGTFVVFHAFCGITIKRAIPDDSHFSRTGENLLI